MTSHNDLLQAERILLIDDTKPEFDVEKLIAECLENSPAPQPASNEGVPVLPPLDISNQGRPTELRSGDDRCLLPEVAPPPPTRQTDRTVQSGAGDPGERSQHPRASEFGLPDAITTPPGLIQRLHRQHVIEELAKKLIETLRGGTPKFEVGPNGDLIPRVAPKFEVGPNGDLIPRVAPKFEVGPNGDLIPRVAPKFEVGPNGDLIPRVAPKFEVGPNGDLIPRVAPKFEVGPNGDLIPKVAPKFEPTEIVGEELARFVKERSLAELLGKQLRDELQKPPFRMKPNLNIDLRDFWLAPAIKTDQNDGSLQELMKRVVQEQSAKKLAEQIADQLHQSRIRTAPNGDVGTVKPSDR